MAVLWTIWRVSPSARFSSPSKPSPVLRWDIFCRVIDNHGDLGVCWRLSADLAQRGHTVRLWVDDASALTWMAPQGCAGISVNPWPHDAKAHQQYNNQTPGSADVVVEAFGCDLPEHVQARIAQEAARRETTNQPPTRWINLEYLSAEDYVRRQHGLPSPVMSGPAKGCTKHFFFPGFTEDTGGLIRERDLLQRQQTFDHEAWRASHAPGLSANARLISLFCYEPVALGPLLEQIKRTGDRLLVLPDRAQAAVQQALLAEAKNRNAHNTPLLDPDWHALPYTDQNGFDEMLWACDLNFVRGEDSLVRALWAGKPFVWQIYPQHDDAHYAKLEAFLDWLQAPESLSRFHAVWNAREAGLLPKIDQKTFDEWNACVNAARYKLLRERDLASKLIDFIHFNQAYE